MSKKNAGVLPSATRVVKKAMGGSYVGLSSNRKTASAISLAPVPIALPSLYSEHAGRGSSMASHSAQKLTKGSTQLAALDANWSHDGAQNDTQNTTSLHSCATAWARCSVPDVLKDKQSDQAKGGGAAQPVYSINRNRALYNIDEEFPALGAIETQEKSSSRFGGGAFASQKGSEDAQSGGSGRVDHYHHQYDSYSSRKENSYFPFGRNRYHSSSRMDDQPRLGWGMGNRWFGNGGYSGSRYGGGGPDRGCDGGSFDRDTGRGFERGGEALPRGNPNRNSYRNVFRNILPENGSKETGAASTATPVASELKTVASGSSATPNHPVPTPSIIISHSSQIDMPIEQRTDVIKKTIKGDWASIEEEDEVDTRRADLAAPNRGAVSEVGGSSAKPPEERGGPSKAVECRDGEPRAKAVECRDGEPRAKAVECRDSEPRAKAVECRDGEPRAKAAECRDSEPRAKAVDEVGGRRPEKANRFGGADSGSWRGPPAERAKASFDRAPDPIEQQAEEMHLKAQQRAREKAEEEAQRQSKLMEIREANLARLDNLESAMLDKKSQQKLEEEKAKAMKLAAMLQKELFEDSLLKKKKFEGEFGVRPANFAPYLVPGTVRIVKRRAESVVPNGSAGSGGASGAEVERPLRSRLNRARMDGHEKCQGKDAVSSELKSGADGRDGVSSAEEGKREKTETNGKVPVARVSPEQKPVTESAAPGGEEKCAVSKDESTNAVVKEGEKELLGEAAVSESAGRGDDSRKNEALPRGDVGKATDDEKSQASKSTGPASEDKANLPKKEAESAGSASHAIPSAWRVIQSPSTGSQSLAEIMDSEKRRMEEEMNEKASLAASSLESQSLNGEKQSVFPTGRGKSERSSGAYKHADHYGAGKGVRGVEDRSGFAREGDRTKFPPRPSRASFYQSRGGGESSASTRDREEAQDSANKAADGSGATPKPQPSARLDRDAFAAKPPSSLHQGKQRGSLKKAAVGRAGQSGEFERASKRDGSSQKKEVPPTTQQQQRNEEVSKQQRHTLGDKKAAPLCAKEAAVDGACHSSDARSLSETSTVVAVESDGSRSSSSLKSSDAQCEKSRTFSKSSDQCESKNYSFSNFASDQRASRADLSTNWRMDKVQWPLDFARSAGSGSRTRFRERFSGAKSKEDESSSKHPSTSSRPASEKSTAVGESSSAVEGRKVGAASSSKASDRYQASRQQNQSDRSEEQRPSDDHQSPPSRTPARSTSSKGQDEKKKQSPLTTNEKTEDRQQKQVHHELKSGGKVGDKAPVAPHDGDTASTGGKASNEDSCKATLQPSNEGAGKFSRSSEFQSSSGGGELASATPKDPACDEKPALDVHGKEKSSESQNHVLEKGPGKSSPKQGAAKSLPTATGHDARRSSRPKSSSSRSRKRFYKVKALSANSTAEKANTPKDSLSSNASNNKHADSASSSECAVKKDGTTPPPSCAPPTDNHVHHPPSSQASTKPSGTPPPTGSVPPSGSDQHEAAKPCTAPASDSHRSTSSASKTTSQPKPSRSDRTNVAHTNPSSHGPFNRSRHRPFFHFDKPKKPSASSTKDKVYKPVETFFLSIANKVSDA
ncbi:serine/arginine repetitive matrix protein 2-like [Schistocerca gregaria]|uniref:serine/arginine repetitive matrix protein 2-like n=1 Tax=Schistocerca gregaria TaxID=7010 RepID=UPI00211EC1CD|nr:serine/arginine repetitive matrix protein 2-like [Schistocerca gregaria]